MTAPTKTLTRRRAHLLLASGALVAALATGCGDDADTGSDAAAPSDTAPGAGSEPGAGAGSGDLDAYCEATLAIETVEEPDIDFEALSPEEQAEEAKAFASETLLPLADDIVAAAPPEVEADIDVLHGVVAELAETGDFSAFEAPEFGEASANAHAFDLENCGWDTVDVEALDYAFSGVPETLEAGVTSFELTNTGEELHEIVLIRKNDDVEETFDQLLELPEEEAMQKTTVVGAAFGAPEETGVYDIVDLEAGEYLAVCFIPQNTTSEDSEGDGPPHFVLGMRTAFTVE